MKRLAAVALAALAITTAACGAGPRQAAATAPLRAEQPADAVDWPIEFRWSGASSDAVVRLHVMDDAERPVASLEVRGTSKTAPESLRALLRPGVRYQWRVARVDENGEEANASAPVTFWLK